MSGTFPPTYPIRLPPETTLIFAGPQPWEFVLSWANSYRGLETCIIMQQPDLVPSGGFVDRDGLLATTPADIAYIVGYTTNATAGPVPVAVMARDGEVNDAYLAYGTMSRAAVNTHLRDNLNIIVREGILPNAANASFAGQGGFLP